MAAADTARLIASLELDNRKFLAGAASAVGSINRIDRRLGAFSGAVNRNLGRLVDQGMSRGVELLFDNVRSGLTSLEDLSRIQGQTRAVIQSTGAAAGVSAQQVRDLAEQQEKLTTVDDKVVQTGENMLLTFTHIGKDVFPAATKAIVDMGVAMNGGSVEGLDLKSTAIQVGKALNDPVKGITALQRVGVTFSAQQKKQIANFVKQGKVADAQRVILAELSREFGNAGRAAGQDAGAGLRRFNDAVGDAQLALATGLAPAIDSIRGEFTTVLSDPGTKAALEGLGRNLGDVAREGIAFARSIPWDKVGSGLQTAAGFAKSLIDAFTRLPPEAQGTMLALAGLNKLSGGAVSGVVSELGKGLIKGVLGMTAGVVNINAGVVNGGPGGPALPGGKIPPVPPGVTVPLIGAAAFLDLGELKDFDRRILDLYHNRFPGPGGSPSTPAGRLNAEQWRRPLDNIGKKQDEARATFERSVAAVEGTTRSGLAGTTGAVNTARSSITSAIAANRPNITANTDVAVYLDGAQMAATVHKKTTVSNRYGPSEGSAGGGTGGATNKYD